ncbi:hypothetical protein Sjap_009260 [Stephania japonica]|uniref:Uncharacterized protein n=1 Tax=Stephania japonica TaxID=461633 RepID=A0AAP0JR17_9MAGN
MGGQGNCVDGKLDDSGYSSPVPLIGLYVTGATLVCLLFILVDVFTSFRSRKRWLPCRLFSLNSITLTLLSIAVKLPLDLTSPMPRVQDQLSKLTGTTLMCICMGIFFPSLGTYRESECFNNMAALTIFVVTIVVNICIQMHTGLIFLFQAEHITIICCMMILLVALWYFASEIHSQNEVSHDGIKAFIMKGRGSMLHRLRVSYVRGYDSNPQFMLCRRPLNTLVATLCVISAVVLMKVAFRYLVSRRSDLCEGVSVYKWSMISIVVSQIIAVVVGCLAITFRLFSMIGHRLGDYGIRQEGVEDAEAIIANNPIFRRTFFFRLKFYSRKIIEIFVTWISLLPSLPFACLEGCVESFPEIRQGEEECDYWTWKNGLNDMGRWIKKIDASNHLIKLLSRAPPLHQDDSPFCQLKAYYDSRKPGYQMSSLSVVLLVRIATISISSSLTASLPNSLNEVFEVLQFVDRKLSASSLENKKKFILAEALWKRENFNYLRPKIVKMFGNNDEFEKQSQLNQSIAIIKGLKEVSLSDYVQHELAMMTDFLLLRAYESIQELYGCIEQLFVDMLNEFLIQLPNAIFREIIESNAEDCEEVVKFALKVLYKVESLEPLVRWSFPVGTTITHLTFNELPNV